MTNLSTELAGLAEAAEPPLGDYAGLVERLGWHSECPATGKLRLTNPDGPDAANAITALTRQLAERDAEMKRLREALRNLHERIADAWPELRHLPPMVEARQALGGDK